jgi:hypothetical protein
VARMNTARGGYSVETLVNVLTSEESVGEFLGSRVEFGGHVHLGGDFAAILHVTCSVKRIANFESMLGILNIFLASREGTGISLILLNKSLLCLNLLVDLGVEFAIFPHFFQYLMFVSALRIFQS